MNNYWRIEIINVIDGKAAILTYQVTFKGMQLDDEIEQKRNYWSNSWSCYMDSSSIWDISLTLQDFQLNKFPFSSHNCFK